LIIELDGGQHATQRDADAERTALLAQQGYGVLRFWDNEVLGNLEGVLEVIARHLDRPSPRPSPQEGRGRAKPSPPKGERVG
jgi:very-short-patch-repair endonuclease